MSEPITIKKKTLTIKSRAVKVATPEASHDGADAVDSGDAPGPFAPQDAIAEGGSERQPSYTVFAILALLATLMFIGIVAVQWTEWSYLVSAFPRPIQAGPIAN